jgi:membrane-bound ClpP family serine protease
MSVTVIILLILLGILLFLVEFLLVPGITVAGIAGGILVIGGVIMGYHHHGSVTGNFILLGTVVFSVGAIYFALKSKTWRGIMLNSDISSKVDLITPEDGKVEAGDVGETITRLNPMGKVQVNGEFYEGKSLDALIDEKTKIEVIRVEHNKLIVKPKK